MIDFTSVKIYAFLSGTWTDISTDVLENSDARWGILGYSPDDIIADIGELKFTLINKTGKYYPDGGSALAGWGAGIKIKQVFTYGGVDYTRFLGYIQKDGLRLTLGLSTESFVEVTALDWMNYAVNTPIISPPVQPNITADTALDTLMSYMPIKASISADTGTYTFPAVFDSTKPNTTAYSEFAKLMYSESPGILYLQKQKDSGQVLVFENSTNRDSVTQKSTVTLTQNNWINNAGDDIINNAGDLVLNHAYTESGSAVVTFTASDLDAVALEYGSNVVNYVTVIANPKRIDTEPRVLYSLPYSIALADGEEITHKGRYIDPDGGGTQVHAVVSSMIQPQLPDKVDPYMMLLLHLTSDFTDSTGRHTVTNNDAGIVDDVYVDPGPEPDVTRITGTILGPYTVLGGYADYNLSVPSSTDFEFEDGPFTIGFYAAVLDLSSGVSVMARDGTTTYAPWVLGKSDGTNLQIFMSSNGSSFDIANGEDWGEIKRNKWVHYEVGRDEDGWFYAFADGKLTATWYSASSFVANSNALSIGKAQGANYMFVGLDEIYIKKGECLHKEEFEPPLTNLSHLLPGDYLLNAADDGTGTDLTSGLEIETVYYPDVVEYTRIKNNSGTAGYLTKLQARGRGIYSYDKIEKVKQDFDSIREHNHQRLTINQAYQQDLTGGSTWAGSIITDEKDAGTRLRAVSFWANKSASSMLRFLQCDVGDLIRVTLTDPGIDNYYHIQNIGYQVHGANLVYVTFGLVEGNTP